MGWFAATAATAGAAVGYRAAEVAADYAGSAIAGGIAYRSLTNTVNNFASMGEYIAGAPGRFFGGLIGRGAAGMAVVPTAARSHALAATISEGTKAAFRPDPIDNKVVVMVQQAAAETSAAAAEPVQASIQATPRTWWDTACCVGKVALPIAVGAGAVAMGAGALVPLVTQLPNAISGVATALAEKAVDPANVNFIDSVAGPVAKDVAIGAVGALAGGIVTYGIVENTYNKRVELGTWIGSIADSYMPECMQGALTAAGTVAGHVDAGRLAMSAATVEKADSVGKVTKQVVETSLQIAASVADQPAAEGEQSSWLKTTAVVVGGIGGAALFTALAPEVAVVTAGAAVLSVAPQLATYIKARVIGSGAAAEAAATEAKETSDDQFVMIEPAFDDQMETEKNQAVDLTASKLANSESVKQALTSSMVLTAENKDLNALNAAQIIAPAA